jgi:hypothetical protein
MNSQFSVTTPAADTSILTIAELRAAAGVTGNSQDADLAALGLRLSASIARQCGVASDGANPPTLLRETCTEIYRLTKAKPHLVLSRRPVTSITSVTISDDVEDAANYVVDAGTGILTFLSGDLQKCWPIGKTTVVYVAGYQSAPDDLKLAASKLATALHSEASRDPSLKREDIPGVLEVEYWVPPTGDPLLTQEIRDLLSPYVQRWI